MDGDAMPVQPIDQLTYKTEVGNCLVDARLCEQVIKNNAGNLPDSFVCELLLLLSLYFFLFSNLTRSNLLWLNLPFVCVWEKIAQS